MLKTSNTKLAEPRKSIVGVSGSKEVHGDRTKLVGKDKIDDSKIGDNKIEKKD